MVGNCDESRPDMSAISSQPLAEVAEILAMGLMRLQARKSSAIFARSKESLLHNLPAKSGHPVPAAGKNADER